MAEKGAKEIRSSVLGISFITPAAGKDRGKCVLLENGKRRVIPPFPHIPRLFSFKQGFKKAFRGDPFVEEKVDGYNVRVVGFGDQAVAITRGGFVCPFSTEWINKHKEVVELVTDNKIILNVEMVGYGNPFNKQSYRYAKRPTYLAFDVYGESGFWSIKERNDLFETYQINTVPSHGFLSFDEIKELIMKKRDEIEGIVMKSEDRSRAVKFVFPVFDIEDIKDNYPLLPDVPAGYFIQRATRVTIFSTEFDLDYSALLGNAFLVGEKEAERMIKTEGEIYEDFPVLVSSPNTAEELVNQTGKNIETDVVDMKKKGKNLEVIIRKRYKKATRFWRERLSGKRFVD